MASNLQSKKKTFPIKTKMIFNAINNQRKPNKIKNIFTYQIGTIKMLITLKYCEVRPLIH